MTESVMKQRRKADELLKESSKTSKEAKAAFSRVTAALEELEEILNGDRRKHADRRY